MKHLTGAACAILLASLTVPASAGIYSDDLARCLVEKTSDEDKASLTRWVFAAIAQGDTVKDMISVSPEQMQGHNRNFARLTERLLTVDCRALVVTAIKHEGDKAIEAGFTTLGEAAFQGLLNDPKATAAMNGLDGMIDESRFEALRREAGLAAEGQ